MDNEIVKKEAKTELLISNRQKTRRRKMKKHVAIYKKKGFFAPSFYDIGNPQMLKWLYLYFTNGFNGSKAFRDSDYVSKNVTQSVTGLKKRLSKQIAELLQGEDIVNDLETDLLGMSNATLADYEEFLTGEKTLKQLEEEGINISPIKSVIQGQDRDGNPYAKIDLESTAGIKEKLLKLKKFSDNAEAKQINIGEQTIIINTNVPSYHDRKEYNKQQKKIIDVETVEVKEIDNGKDKE